MGNKHSQLTKSELHYYKELTYLTEREIQYIFTRFKNLQPRILNKDKYARIPVELIKKIPELQNNPFRNRIGDIFSSANDSAWSFEDFLDMASVFNSSTPAEKKAEYAFQIYDFDGDGFLSRRDLKTLLCFLIGEEHLEDSDVQDVIDQVMDEGDIDKDGMLSPAEFSHVLSKCPDFARSFTIRL